MPDLTDPRESRDIPRPRPDFSIARARDGDDDLLGPCFVFVLARCRCIKYSELDTPTPIRPRPTRDELGLGFSPRDCLPSSASASASSSWAPDPFVSVRPVPSKRKPKSAGASKTPAGGGSVLCRYRVARSPWRAATVDGAQFRPNPNAQPERDETLTFPLVRAGERFPTLDETCPPSDRARVRAPGRDRRDERLDETRQVRANATPRADDVPVARPGPSHQAAARGSPSAPSAFFGPQSDTRLYWSAGGRSLTTCAPMRLGLETAWKDHDRRVGSLSSFASFSVSSFSSRGSNVRSARTRIADRAARPSRDVLAC